MHISRRAFVALLLAVALNPSPHAQSKRRLTLVDLLNVPRLTDPQLSPDGRQVIYQLAEADWKTNKRISHIWRVGIDGGGLVKMTNAMGEQSARWSPDGNMIAFAGKRALTDEAQVYVISNAGGEAKAVTHHATSVSRLTWSPDGKSIYFVAGDPKTSELKDRESLKDDVFAFDENYQQNHVGTVAVDSGTESRITSGDFSVLEYRLSDDGKKIVMHRAATPLLESADTSEVWLTDADGSHAQQVTNNRVPENSAFLSPDNSQVLFLAATNERFDKYYTRRLFAMPASGGSARVISPPDYEIDRALFSKDGKSIYFLANRGAHAELFVMPAG